MMRLLQLAALLALVGLGCVAVGNAQLHAQLPMNQAAFTGSPGGGGGNPFTLTASGKCADTGGGSAGCTISGINATGANLIIFDQVYYGPGTQPTVTDSSSNTYGQSQMVSYYVNSGSNCAIPVAGSNANCMFFLINPAVSGSMTFTCGAGASSYQSCLVEVWTRAGGAPTCDTSKMVGTASASITTLQPGSITPGAANNLLLTGIGLVPPSPNTTTLSIGSGYTLDYNPGAASNSLASGLAYLKQTAATAQNPTWASTVTGGGGTALHMVCI